jgi:DNA-binding NtrC family response regulator
MTITSPPRPRLLVVDDLEPIRTALARGLRHSFSAATAPGAHAALKLMSQERFDAVLTDFEMPPGPDGVWLLTETMRLHPAVRRFLGTGSQPEQFEPYVRSGVIEVCFHKPIAAVAFTNAYHRRPL